MDLYMSLIKRKLGESFLLENQNESYSVEKLLKDIQKTTKGLIDPAKEQIKLALLHDTLSIDKAVFDRWLLENNAAILRVCQEIWIENQSVIYDQAENLGAMHHTPAHAQDVSKRATHLFNQLRMSTSNSLRDKAYAAIRDLFIKSHDLVQGQGLLHNEVQTKQLLFQKLLSKLNIKVSLQPDVYHMLDIMGHRLIVLGTTLIFDKQVFDLAELYIETQRFFELPTPFETFNQEMLITGLCDRAPACCEELIHMVYNSPLGLKEKAQQTLLAQNPLCQFLKKTPVFNPYPHLNQTQNLIAFLIAMSPHQGMSLELSILPKEKREKIFFELRELLTIDEKGLSLRSFILGKSQILRLKEKEKNSRLNPTEQLLLRKHQLAKLLLKHNDATSLRSKIIYLKHQIWHSSWTLEGKDIAFQSFISQYNDVRAPIPDEDLQLKHYFENIFIDNLDGESFFSKAQEASILFLANEFKDKLHIYPEVALADANNMTVLDSYYRSLNQYQQLQFMYELLFPLVYQMGEFYMALSPITNNLACPESEVGSIYATKYVFFQAPNRKIESSHITTNELEISDLEETENSP